MAVLNSVMRACAVAALPTPAELLAQQPCPAPMQARIAQHRQQASNILSGADDRLLVVIGPCSLHDPKAALDYAKRLAPLAEQYGDRLQIVMRAYFEKPRTTVGWKGLVFDPYLDGSHDLDQGLRLARQLLLDIGDLGLATATEFLDTTSFLYLADLISWGAIGARTTESQVHRQLASALPCPVGFKNGTDGNVRVAMDAIQASQASHLFTAPGSEGGMVVIRSEGNEAGHIILRGGAHPNYHRADVEAAAAQLRQQGLNGRLMVDCSHGNSQKQHKNQLRVAEALCHQLADGSQAIAAVMVESFLIEGCQAPAPLSELTYGQSVTDACLHWDDSLRLLAMLADAVSDRRRQHLTQRAPQPQWDAQLAG
ncbi:3-deoxy-7-phosphoheptulonate synthase [Aeromonas sp. BIGb0445]|uniref:3-deoxy-7-phosphoheptulonate synthase n=1 Tax=Aeromonas sp. BIGb0445 TaxID=2940593 RepID=UPI002168E9D7|nr:3-deoxy-7-phosphoheptulonate synthase [Aeromonas sp. BIGb0445]MCS3459666.1 3-deoxy-7-phosphoheptulonate synthase [Aeromonas sp. BIGb0445]